MKQKKATDFSLGLIRETVQWKGRDAVRLSNGIVELIGLAGGGHLAAFRFLEGDGRPSQNVFWEAPWRTSDPDREWSEDMSNQYGPVETGRFLSGFTGHALCLDYFGEASPEKAAAGLGLHGEAAITRWNVLEPTELRMGQCRWIVNLPISRLTFERTIHINEGESVAYVEETVRNERDTEHRCDWVQHVTFGPPFLQCGASTINASAHSGISSPFGYEGKSLLADDVYASWPFVQRESGDGAADLRVPFVEKGRGFLAGMMLDPTRRIQHLVAINWSLRLGIGYCFRSDDFPWMAIWEENCARQDVPWNGATQARGMEFGTTPLPLTGNGGLADNRFSGTPRDCAIAAHGEKTARYLMFLFSVPAEVRSIKNVTPVSNAILFHDVSGRTSFSIPAKGCEAFLS